MIAVNDLTLDPVRSGEDLCCLVDVTSRNTFADEVDDQLTVSSPTNVTASTRSQTVRRVRGACPPSPMRDDRTGSSPRRSLTSRAALPTSTCSTNSSALSDESSY